MTGIASGCSGTSQLHFIVNWGNQFCVVASSTSFTRDAAVFAHHTNEIFNDKQCEEWKESIAFSHGASRRPISQIDLEKTSVTTQPLQTSFISRSHSHQIGSQIHTLRMNDNTRHQTWTCLPLGSYSQQQAKSNPVLTFTLHETKPEQTSSRQSLFFKKKIYPSHHYLHSSQY